MKQLYNSVGISKQAINQYAKRQACFDYKLQQLVCEADELRREHPGCGVEKMYYTLRPDFIGRDRFIDSFMELGYRIKRFKNYRRTTYVESIYYPNLIKGMLVNAPSVVWQSDITYLRVGSHFYYAVFLIDVYTKKIVCYQVSNHLRATANVKALKKALKTHQAPMIHHSDRGSQYTYGVYLELLKQHHCSISMSLIAQENAYAERIHRTIKEEYLSHWNPQTYEQLLRAVKKAVDHYNTKRPHNHLNKLSPVEFENQWKLFKQLPLLTIFDNENINKKTVNAI